MNELIGAKLQLLLQSDGTYLIDFSNSPRFLTGSQLSRADIEVLTGQGVICEIRRQQSNEKPLILG